MTVLRVYAGGACLIAGLAWSGTAAAEADIRINQLGYETGGSAVAYLITTAPESGGNFTVVDDTGTAVFNAPVPASTGTWGSYTVYRLSFPAKKPGRYTLEVTGNVTAASHAFSIAKPAKLYAVPLANALSFYQNERDGSDYIASPLRTAPAHLNDASATVFTTPPVQGDRIVGDLSPTGQAIDTSGGWWDAGDYLKFVETHSYTVAMLLTGVRDFPSQLGASAPASDFTSEAKFGTSWLLKMWDDKAQQLFYETGIGIDFVKQKTLSDHDLWRLPQVDDTLKQGDADYQYINHRPVFAAGPAGAPISPNLAGRLAATFALCFTDYKNTDLAFAQRCLLSAEHIFDLANTKPGRLLTALPYDFYPETEWRDDLEWGATELDIAITNAGKALPANLPHSDPAYYLTQAANWAHAYITGPNDAADTLNLYDTSGIAHYELYRAIDLAGDPQGLAVSKADLVADLERQLAGATKQANRDPFGFGVSWGTYDTTSHGAGLSLMASEYAQLTGTGSWNNMATGWLGNIMGANIWGLSLIVGDGTNFPDCLQHQVANIEGSLSGKSPVLAGAAVEGPNATNAIAHGFLDGMRACPPGGSDRYKKYTGDGARFWDNQQNYPNTEPAIDLTATSPLMFAWRIAGAPQPLRR